MSYATCGCWVGPWYGVGGIPTCDLHSVGTVIGAPQQQTVGTTIIGPSIVPDQPMFTSGFIGTIVGATVTGAYRQEAVDKLLQLAKPIVVPKPPRSEEPHAYTRQIWYLDAFLTEIAQLLTRYIIETEKSDADVAEHDCWQMAKDQLDVLAKAIGRARAARQHTQK
jgi:hypothetical protein